MWQALPNVDTLCLIKLPHYFEANGDLVVMERGVDISFEIARVFVVRAPDGAIRGQHAHRNCSQFFTCSIGAIQILCDDGERKVEFVLDNPNLGLLIPPGIWSQQTYKGVQATLTVLCDQRYDAEEYIRDYGIFLKFRGNARTDQSK
jgi:dTDP-4-dehydrorhamnose 3,5-epimerase-like enzyme